LLVRTRTRMDVVWQDASDHPRAPDGPPPGGGRRRSRALGAGASVLVLAIAPALLLAGCSSAGARADHGSTAAAGKPTPLRAPAPPASLARQVAFLQAAQNPDGGFGGARGQASTELFSAWSAMGLAAAGRDPLGVRRHGHNVLHVLRGQAGTLRGAGDLE